MLPTPNDFSFDENSQFIKINFFRLNAIFSSFGIFLGYNLSMFLINKLFL